MCPVAGCTYPYDIIHPDDPGVIQATKAKANRSHHSSHEKGKGKVRRVDYAKHRDTFPLIGWKLEHFHRIRDERIMNWDCSLRTKKPVGAALEQPADAISAKQQKARGKRRANYLADRILAEGG